jgi:lysine 6-dehydrogenase
MKRILILGCGMVGSTIAADLSDKFDTAVADSDRKKLSSISQNFNLKTEIIDLRKKGAIQMLIKDYDIIVNALPGSIGYATLEAIIGEGKDVVDISFFPEDAFNLDTAAREKNVTAVVDCGVAPGLSNILLGYHYSKEKLSSFACYVGGLPFERTHPYQYKAPFSPSDVIEEYTRPARIKEGGELKIKPALSEQELLNFRNIGTLEGFNSDGLRSLLITMDIPDMKEKTLRYPGHAEAVRLLRDTGFFSSDEIKINGMDIKPVDLSSKLLFDIWKLKEDDDEFTIMQVFIDSEMKRYNYFLFDRKDKETGFSSMARTTGFTCTAVVNLLAEGRLKHKGITPPEYVGMDEMNFRYILNYLSERKVAVEFSEQKL